MRPRLCCAGSGRTGRGFRGVVAIDKSERFLGALDAKCRERSTDNITACPADFDAGEFPEVIADCAWCRWVFAFVKNPRALLARIAGLACRATVP